MKSEIIEQPKHEITPAEMIMAAVSGQADLDKVEKLLALQERWEANEAKKAFHKAMTSFKENPIEIEKDKKVGYSTDKGKVGYSHATLANVVRTITKELSKHGLSATWKTDQSPEARISVTCRITHVLGHSEETTISAAADTSGSKNSIQAIGSTITYLERYTLLALTGLATSDQDDDAKANDVLLGYKELSAIRDLLVSKELTEGNLAKYMGVEKIEDIKLTDYMKALTAINAAAKKKDAVVKK